MKPVRLAMSIALAMGASAARANAMPVFAEAYGYDCSKCHIQVPELNAFGRYVQRTMYSVLDRQTLASTAPIWVGEAAFSDTQDPNHPHRAQFGNLAIHGSGFIAKDLTTHVQQWLYLNDRPGPLDTAWVSYDRIFGKNTHLTVGKGPPAGPSFFSQWSDLAPFAVPQIAVGEHTQGLASNRWGAKLGYTNAYVTADAGWYGSSADVNGASDFSQNADKTAQWHVAYAPLARPIQVGAYGNAGVFPLAFGKKDRYSAAGVYAQLDAVGTKPGVLVLYQRGFDARAGTGLGSVASSGSALELSWHPLRRYEATLSARGESTNDGLGTFKRFGTIGLSFRVARFVHAYVESYAQANAKPGLRYQLWWTTPIQRSH